MADDLGTPALRLEREGSIAWCVIDRPAARNALTPAMYYGLKRAVALVNTDPDLAALVITGTDDVFAPGGDLGGRSEPGETVPDVSGADVLPFLAIRDSQAPVIAAVNGICQAGGLLIAMLADIAVASDRATFRVPELLRGIPDATYAAVLPAHVGVAVARDLLLSARRFDAAEAVRLGVISRVVAHDELRAAARRGRGAGAADRARGADAREAHAQRALRQHRLPDHVLGVGPLARAARGHAGVHGEASAELDPRGRDEAAAMTAHRVAQWATGNIGTRSLRGVIEHPALDLVGVYVYSEAKAGVDAGALCGLAPTGVIATRDVDEIVGLGADCVLYMPRALDVDEVCRLLAAGTNVVTTRGEFHHPPSMDPTTRSRVEEACQQGSASIHSTGSSPGFITEAIPLVLTSIQRRLDALSIEEFADLSRARFAGVAVRPHGLRRASGRAERGPAVPRPHEFRAFAPPRGRGPRHAARRPGAQRGGGRRYH